MKKLLIAIIIIAGIMSAQEKKGIISFKDDVMPIFQKKCMNCHNTEDESPSGFYLDNYAELMKGDSRNGPVVIPKKGEESILILKLRGTATFGKQMPRGKIVLDANIIDMISKWIDQGAKNN